MQEPSAPGHLLRGTPTSTMSQFADMVGSGAVTDCVAPKTSPYYQRHRDLNEEWSYKTALSVRDPESAKHFKEAQLHIYIAAENGHPVAFATDAQQRLKALQHYAGFMAIENSSNMAAAKFLNDKDFEQLSANLPRAKAWPMEIALPMTKEDEEKTFVKATEMWPIQGPPKPLIPPDSNTILKDLEAFAFSSSRRFLHFAVRCKKDRKHCSRKMQKRPTREWLKAHKCGVCASGLEFVKVYRV